MPKARSPELVQAIESVRAGMRIAEAIKLYQVNPPTLYRLVQIEVDFVGLGKPKPDTPIAGFTTYAQTLYAQGKRSFPRHALMRSPKMQAAIKAVVAGERQSRAAKIFGVPPSNLCRAIKNKVKTDTRIVRWYHQHVAIQLTERFGRDAANLVHKLHRIQDIDTLAELTEQHNKLDTLDSIANYMDKVLTESTETTPD